MEMNRIVLIGNGFDLAHGLPTKYEDFINWYLTQRIISFSENRTLISEDPLCKFSIIENHFTWYDFYMQHCQLGFSTQAIIDKINNNINSIRLQRSPLFEKITNDIKIKGWTDIETRYYIYLCLSLQKFQDSDNISYEYKYRYKQPDILNNELEFIKSKLAEYLTFIQDSANDDWKLNEDIKQYLLAPFNPNDIAVESKSSWSDFITYRLNCPDEYWGILLDHYAVHEINWQFQFIKNFRNKFHEYTIDTIPEDSIPKSFLIPDKIMLLNFNYTNIADSYMPKLSRFPVNHIHGDLTKPENMIFGYGDELDNNFKNLQNLNDNEYLRNIKSVRYLESANYRQMLSFIESAPYQVYIMGHSCGNSDRTLLNTLFEHKNCVSIKPFYYKNEQDESDNYLDIVQNISRSFTDMKLMRDRVVNKTFCVPLPQSSLQNNS